MRVQFDGEKVIYPPKPKEPKYGPVVLTFMQVNVPSSRRRVRAHRKRIKGRRVKLNTFGCVRTIGRKPLRAMPKILTTHDVRWGGVLLVPSLSIR